MQGAAAPGLDRTILMLDLYLALAENTFPVPITSFLLIVKEDLEARSTMRRARFAWAFAMSSGMCLL